MVLFPFCFFLHIHIHKKKILGDKSSYGYISLILHCFHICWSHEKAKNIHAKITESVGREIIFKGGYCFVISAKNIGK